MASIFQTKAAEVAKNLTVKEGMAAEDVEANPFIDFIMQLLLQLLPMLLTCLPKNTPPDKVLEAAQNLRLMQRWTLRRQINKAINDSSSQDMLSGPLDRQIRSMIATLTVPEMESAVADVW